MMPHYSGLFTDLCQFTLLQGYLDRGTEELARAVDQQRI